MKIVILENRPLVMQKVLEFFLAEEKVSEIIIAFYMESKEEAPPQEYYEATNEMFDKLRISYRKNITCNDVIRKDFGEFLDQYYTDEDAVIIFDAILNRKWTGHMSTWPNIVYAMTKENKTWLYTTGPESILRFINSTFPGKNIPVQRFDVEEQQLYLDFDYIEKKILH